MFCKWKRHTAPPIKCREITFGRVNRGQGSADYVLVQWCVALVPERQWGGQCLNIETANEWGWEIRKGESKRGKGGKSVYPRYSREVSCHGIKKYKKSLIDSVNEQRDEIEKIFLNYGFIWAIRLIKFQRCCF